MATKNQQIQRLIRMYREEKGVQDYKMRDVVDWAVERGFPLPRPVDPRHRLTKRFVRAASEEVRYDDVTGRPYRANHAFTAVEKGQNVGRWFDLDDVPRSTMEKYKFQRRQHLVGEGVQLMFDFDHWNRINPNEEPIRIDLDLAEEVQWAINAPDEKKKAS